ncbi:MAG TPA: RNA polymerase sigma factor [Candidatus Izemoplasmatales bacterium]|nr:RNA polymerase sigma factor [Bacillota bacterium]HRY78016.1 RNA polymerase sigma factor [Candidatus Izemoplasmatales bacterium]
MPNPIEDYLDLLAQKDDQAFAFVYEQTKRGVYSVIASLIPDRQTIEDLMQDTYIKMLKNLNLYQRGRNFPAWLLEIAKNLAYDHLRQNRMVTPADPQTESYLFDRQSPRTESTDYTMEELTRGLDSEEKQIVLLRVVAETKFKTIAETVGKPLGTVLWIYNRALAKMKKSLGKE